MLASRSVARFAYGADEIKGVACPARAAGVRASRTFAVWYDHEVRKRTHHARRSGVVREAIAREAWLCALHQARDHLDAPPRGAALRLRIAEWYWRLTGHVKAHEEVARALGWL